MQNSTKFHLALTSRSDGEVVDSIRASIIGFLRNQADVDLHVFGSPDELHLGHQTKSAWN